MLVKMMKFALKMMNSLQQMMNCVLKTMNFEAGAADWSNR